MVVLNPSLSARPRSGFTLIEILVVMMIIVLLGSVLIGVTGNSLVSMGLTGSGDALKSTISGAREAATATGKPVEVRFFYPDATGTSVESIEAFSVADDGTYDPEGLPWRPGDGAFLDLSSTYSNLPDSSAPISQDAGGRSYRSFVFRPDGSVELDLNTTFFVTLKSETLEANYYSVTVDPATGTVRAYRP